MSEHTEDESLLTRAVAGDRDARESLLLRNFDRLNAEISRRIPDDIRGTISAEDVAQEAFIVAFQRIGSLQAQGIEAFFGWLAQIAENRLMDAAKALRAAKRGGGWGRISDADSEAADVVPVLEMFATHSKTPSRSAAAHEAVAAMEAALNTLDPDYRAVLRMRYIDGLPATECAQRLQRSEGAVHMLLSRALLALRAKLGESGRYFTRKP